MAFPFTWSVTLPNPATDRVNTFPSTTAGMYWADKTTLRDAIPLTDKGAGASLGWRTQQYGNVIWTTYNAGSTDGGVTFNRDDVAGNAFALRRNADGTVDYLSAPVAANPITWTVITKIDLPAAKWNFRVNTLDFTAGAAVRIGTTDAFDLIFKRGGLDQITITTGQLIVPIGSAALPSYTFSGNTTSGLYVTGGGNINAAVGGVSRVFMKDSGFAIGSAMAPDTAGLAFHVRTETLGTRTVDMSYAATDANSWLLRIFKARGSHAALAAINSADSIGDVQFLGHTGTSYYQGAGIQAVAAEAFTATAGGTDLLLNATRVTQQTLRVRYRIFGGVSLSHQWWNADGTLLAQFDHASAAGNTVLSIARDGTTVSLVSLGAVDSGGVGFRLLRVPN